MHDRDAELHLRVGSKWLEIPHSHVCTARVEHRVAGPLKSSYLLRELDTARLVNQRRTVASDFEYAVTSIRGSRSCTSPGDSETRLCGRIWGSVIFGIPSVDLL